MDKDALNDNLSSEVSVVEINNVQSESIDIEEEEEVKSSTKDLYDIPYRVKKDESELVKLIDGVVSMINVVGDWLYFEYNLPNQGTSMYKMKIDGTELTLLSNERNYVFLNIVEDWVYYVDYGGNKDVYKIKVDGSENKHALQ